MSTAPITVCIPTIPPRAHLLDRALRSVDRQTLSAYSVVVEQDAGREGAAVTRQRALEQVTTEWVAFLDDDDEFLPHHLLTLHTAALVYAADYVYSWYTVQGGSDPLPHFGKAFDPCHPTQTTVTTLVRTELAQSCGFLPAADPTSEIPTPDGNTSGEDWIFTLRCVAADASIIHVPRKTWIWHHHGFNTSGRPNW